MQAGLEGAARARVPVPVGVPAANTPKAPGGCGAGRVRHGVWFPGDLAPARPGGALRGGASSSPAVGPLTWLWAWAWGLTGSHRVFLFYYRQGQGQPLPGSWRGASSSACLFPLRSGPGPWGGCQTRTSRSLRPQRRTGPGRCPGRSLGLCSPHLRLCPCQGQQRGGPHGGRGQPSPLGPRLCGWPRPRQVGSNPRLRGACHWRS